MEQYEELYAKGFNNGYLIAKHEPQLYITLEKGFEGKNDYLEGFVSGGKEYEIEKNSPQKHQHKGKNKSRDIDYDR